MAKKSVLDFEIDKLTNSIENTLTGEVFDTEITRLDSENVRQIKKYDWLFDWKAELRKPSAEVYMLTTLNNKTVIQGLISIEDKGDHVFMRLIESAKFNKNKNKMYFGVPGNLIAFACKLSFERGYLGFIAFDAKTSLIKHYQETLFATHFRGKRMFIETIAAKRLILQYFKS